MPPSKASHSSIRRILVLAVLIVFMVGFGGGVVTVRMLDRPVPGDDPAALAARAPSVPIAAPTGPAAPAPPMATATPMPPPVPSLAPPVVRPRAAARLEPERLAARPLAEEPTDPPRLSHQLSVRRGDTLMHILTRLGVGRDEAYAAIASLSELFDPRRLRVGQQLALELEGSPEAEGKQLASLSLTLDFTQDLVLTREDDGAFTTSRIERPLERETLLGAGGIDDSLYMAGQRAGLPHETLAELIRVFSWDVDFQRDIHPGDRFEALYDVVSTADGAETRGGDLLFASLRLAGRTLSAYRFERDDGEADYFDRDGRSLRKFLLRTPVDGARLSSGFGPRRHPILGYNRMHRGVDFAAPTGTPIYAAGEGAVEFVGANRGYGNYVKIRHNSRYSTLYAHLSRFASGLKRGQRVRQGQVIGYVGATGMATGPHLHYEVFEDGEQVNPLKVEVAEVEGLSGAELERFRRTVAALEQERRELRGTQLASRNE